MRDQSWWSDLGQNDVPGYFVEIFLVHLGCVISNWKIFCNQNSHIPSLQSRGLFRFYGYIHCFSLDGLKRGCFLPLSSLCHLYELWRTVMDPTVKTKQDKEKFPLFLLTEWAQVKTFQSWQRQWINSWNWHKWQRYWWWHYALWISDLS